MNTDEQRIGKKRILFVDDEPLLARAFVTVLQNDGHWEVRSASSGAQALQLVAQAPFDVVVADIRMPGMSGLQLIEEIRQRHPRTSRVLISGMKDQEEVARCLGDTHQFISKPVDLKTLRDTLNRICNLDQFLMDDRLRTLVAQCKGLPSFPALYMDVVGELASPDPSIERIAEIVGQDPGMTAKMLQIVNSVMFGLARRISSPFEAVQFLGTGTVRSLVLSVHVFSCFDQTVKGFSMEHFWQHALRTGALSRIIAQSLDADPTIVEEAYIAGMLHDVGRLMLASSLPEQFEKAVNLAAQRRVPLHEAEPDVYGSTHASVGGYLLGLWGLPVTLVEAVAFHHTPAKSQIRTISPLTAVHIADSLDHELAPGNAECPMGGLDVDYLSALGIGSRLEEWREESQRLAVPDPE